ncbi:MAG: DegV family protein [Chloroflexi bacterium]|nr:DegV family protein [Chloroflexota bacterium]MBI5956218.1 DegV family protein [Chloroflexota bacterium]
MDGQQVVVATDGGVDLNPELINQLGIVIVPRRIQVGGRVYEISRKALARDVEARVGAGARGVLSPPQLDDFLITYRECGRGGAAVVSVHPPNALDPSARLARVAKNLVTPAINLQVFEANTLGAGVGFMAQAAAQAALGDSTLDQITILLSRLQSTVQTLFLTKDLKGLPTTAASTGLEGLKKGLLGSTYLLSVDRSSGAFKVEQEGSTIRLAKSAQLFNEITGPCNAWIAYRGMEGQARQMQQELSRLPQLQIENVQMGRATLLTSSYFPGDFVQLLIYPAQAELERMRRWARSLAKWR